MLEETVQGGVEEGGGKGVGEEGGEWGGVAEGEEGGEQGEGAVLGEGGEGRKEVAGVGEEAEVGREEEVEGVEDTGLVVEEETEVATFGSWARVACCLGRWEVCFDRVELRLLWLPM